MFHNRPKLADPNVHADWIDRDEWREWGAPLNVVRGESRHQEEFIQLCGPPNPHGYLLPVVVTLLREPTNPVDKSAILVQVGDVQAGYIVKEIAGLLSPELDKAKCKSFMVAGIIRGGSSRYPTFGLHLWLDHLVSPGPTIRITEDARWDPELAVKWNLDEIAPPRPRVGNEISGLRTGAHAHGGRWMVLQEGDRLKTIESAREFLKREQDPLERHYAFNTLEEALYKCRNAFPSALTDFEATCEQHDHEMTSIRPALIGLFGGVPFLPTYKQLVIMKAKAGDHAAAVRWSERGLDVYGADALETEGTTDLRRRLDKLSRKLQ